MNLDEINESPTCPLCHTQRPVEVRTIRTNRQPYRREELGGCPRGCTLEDFARAGIYNE